MKDKQLLHKLIINSLICGGILAGVIVLFLIQVHMESNNEQAKATAQSELDTLNQKVVKLHQKQQEIEEATKLWERLNDREKKAEGLKIDTIKEVFDSMKNQYGIVSAGLNLSTPVELGDIYKTPTTVVVSSTVNVDLKGVTDENIFLFIEELTKKIPGYLHMTKLQMMRSGQLDEFVLKKIDQGEMPSLVTGQLIFEWRDLKDIMPKAADSPQP